MREEDGELMYAELIYDSARGLTGGPKRMGEPRRGDLEKGDQLVGSPLERLAELAGRVCYDSLGKGRDSPGFHEHILQVGHLSVYEHCTFTVVIPTHYGRDALLAALINRPGLWVEATLGGRNLRITANFRTVLEWDMWEPVLGSVQEANAYLGDVLLYHATNLAPNVFVEERPPFEVGGQGKLASLDSLSDDETWVTFFMTGSRGFSHELVRHGDFTAISQRSTRYVDESESPWVEHPLIAMHDVDQVRLGEDGAKSTIKVARGMYGLAVRSLQTWLEGRGVSKHNARKQARGAARGFLGNALYTELIFSATVAQWKRMIAQRSSEFADAEIRVIFEQVVEALIERFPDRFAGYELVPSPDGIGRVTATNVTP